MSSSVNLTSNARPMIFPVQLNATFNVTSTNNSIHNRHLSLQWNFMSEFLLFIAIAGVSFNGIALLRFMKDRTLLNPFTIKVILLLTLNVISCLTQWGLSAVAILYSGRGKWVLGNRACDLFLLSNCVVNALIMNTHGLLAVNRAWAVLHPFSYRRHHSQRLALQIVAGLIVYCILVMVPFWLMDAVTYRLPLDVNGCTPNVDAQAVYNVATALVVFALPVAVVWVAFFVVMVNKLARLRRSRRVLLVHPVKESTNGATGLTSDEKQLAKRSRWQGYLVLTILSVSVTVCYGPRVVYATLRLFIPSISHPFFFQVASMLFALQIVLDPILLSLTIGKWPGSRCGVCL
ncbi:hypothetical protein BV898_16366 [Hypsibius exemplaris]|uniref:G-protein coupled receptors family 1 profile domain-containing protein n=1 Tax=Hypsibius exemplaris TaxID=2072580 RepID=A0A9X6RLE8_HYPEX|nr:hypothetical protein BV898_16366 [Hypsibius exemplaris]